MNSRLLLVIFYAVCGVSFVHAQTNTTGHIVGRVVTSEDIVVQNTIITVTNLETQNFRAIPGKTDGSFRFAALPVGTYRLSVESPGYMVAEREPIRVSIGSGTKLNVVLIPGDAPLQLDKVSVVSKQTSMIDVTSTESTTIITDQQINRLPVGRDLESVALLAPGTTRSPVFGLVGFGGASVAENAYYVNGMNLTNFRNGMGGGTVPFEFYREFEVKTGGYGAEFGRSTGGVVNAVTKRGGDEFSFGTSVFWEPDSLRENSSNISQLNDDILDYQSYESANESDSLNANLYASGPVFRDHLYFYALIEHRKNDSYSESGPSSTFGWPVVFADSSSSDDIFWGIKLDWQINQRHLLELTAFTDQTKTINGVSEIFPPTGELNFLGESFSERGGKNTILRYTGYFGQNLTLSVLAGQSDYNQTDRSPNDNIPVTWDNREQAPTPFPTDWLNFRVGQSSDERRMFRFDGEWDLGKHLLRFGVDSESNRTDDLGTFSGGVYWQYFDAMPGEQFPGGIIPDGVTQITRERIVDTGGGFEVENTAFYLEDHWTIGDDLVVYGGIRRETFNNKNAVGKSFIEMNNQWGPRLGFAWDIKGDLSGKLYGTAGRYFLPMPTTVNMHMSGALLFTDEWSVLNGLEVDGSPDKGEILANLVISDGTVPDVTELLDTDLDSTYQDEYILGYTWEIAKGWSVGVRGIYRDLKNVIEDVSFGRLLNAYAAENGFEEFFVDPFSAFVLTNPGTDANLRFDLDYDGVYEEIHFNAQETGMPKVDRTYKAIELYFKRRWDNRWSLQGSYTYSQSRGNYEGWTNSYSGQADGPVMAAFDHPEIMEGANGKLISDRPHTFKLFGSWEFAEHFLMSGNALFQSGIPYGAIGCHPDLGAFYGCQFFYDGDELVNRGSRGRTDNVYQLDFGLQYSLMMGKRNSRLVIGVDVINLFDLDSETGVDEYVGDEVGSPNLNYLHTSGFQQPRYVRISARLDF